MYVCMHLSIYSNTYSKSIDQPGKVANSTRGQLNRKMNFSLSPFAPENLVSRDGFDSPVPRQPAHLYTQVESGAYYGIPPDSRGGVHLFIRTVIRHQASPEFIGSCNCVPMAFTAESPSAQGH